MRALLVTRRRFLRESLQAASIAAVGAAIVARGDEAGRAKPLAYDVDRMLKVDPKLVKYEEITRFAAPGAEPHRIAVGPDNKLYVAAGKRVSILSADGGQTGELMLGSVARSVAVDQDGTCYVGLKEHVEVFSKGSKVATWESPGKKVWLTGIVVGANEVFVADAGNRVVLRYDKGGKLTGRIGERDPERSVPGLVVPSPYLDVALGKDGLLRVNNPGRHRVEVYTVHGDLEAAWGKPTAAIDGFCGCCNPIAVACLPDGRQVTCEKGLPRVKIYSEEGQFDCVVAGPESFPENARAGSARSRSDGVLGGLDAAVDSQGRVYILDLVGGTIRVMKAKA